MNGSHQHGTVYEHDDLTNVTGFDCKTPKCPGYRDVAGTGRAYRDESGSWFMWVYCRDCDSTWAVNNAVAQEHCERLFKK